MQGQASAQEWVMYVSHIHGLEGLSGGTRITQGQVIARVGQRQPGRTQDARLVVLKIQVAEGEDVHVVTCLLEIAFVQVDVIRDPADVRFVRIHHHSDAHKTSFWLCGNAKA